MIAEPRCELGIVSARNGAMRGEQPVSTRDPA